MLTIETKPATYKSRVSWYVANWRTRTATIFDSKAKAVMCANADPDSAGKSVIVNVGWIDAEKHGHAAKIAIGDFEIADMREGFPQGKDDRFFNRPCRSANGRYLDGYYGVS